MFSSIPPITRNLLIANVAAFVAQLLLGTSPSTESWVLWVELWPWLPPQLEHLGPCFMPWQLLTYGFLHGGVGHLAFNMLALVMFGASL